MKAVSEEIRYRTGQNNNSTGGGGPRNGENKVVSLVKTFTKQGKCQIQFSDKPRYHPYLSGEQIITSIMYVTMV